MNEAYSGEPMSGGQSPVVTAPVSSGERAGVPIAEFASEAAAEELIAKLWEAGIPEHSFLLRSDPPSRTPTLFANSDVQASDLLLAVATVSQAVPAMRFD